MEPTHDPALAELLSFFDFAHLRERTPHLAAASEPFHRLAHIMAPDPSAAVDGLRATILRMDCEPGREAAAAALKLRRLEAALVAPDYAVIDSAGPEDFLRTLLEAKDCAVRAALVRHRAEQADGLTSSKTVAVADLPGLLAGVERLAVQHNRTIASRGAERLDAAGNLTMAADPGVAMPERWPGEHAGKGESGQPDGGGRGGHTTREQAIADMLAMGMTRERAESILGAAGLQSSAYSDEIDAAHAENLRGMHNAPPPRIISRHFTMTAGGPAFDPPAEPHAEADLGAVARAAIADGDKGIAALGEAASSLGVDVGAPKMFTAAFCRWWHEQTGEHYGPGLHESAPVEMSGASRVFEAGRRSALKRERLADFVVGIDVEQGPGLAVLRGLVTELAAVADRLEAALPADAARVRGDIAAERAKLQG